MYVYKRLVRVKENWIDIFISWMSSWFYFPFCQYVNANYLFFLIDTYRKKRKHGIESLATFSVFFLCFSSSLNPLPLTILFIFLFLVKSTAVMFYFILYVFHSLCFISFLNVIHSLCISFFVLFHSLCIWVFKAGLLEINHFLFYKMLNKTDSKDCISFIKIFLQKCLPCSMPKSRSG